LRIKPIKLIEGFGVLILIFMVIIVLLQVFTRYVLGSPLLWTEELSRVSLIWITFLSAVILFTQDKHIKIEVISFKKNYFLYSLVNFIVEIGKLIVVLILAFYGPIMMKLTWGSLLPASQISRGIFIYGALSLAGIVMLLDWIWMIIGKVKKGKGIC